MNVEARVKNFILENFLFTDDPSAIDEADSFLDKGIIDSTGVMEVILFLDEEFGIKVTDDEIVPENLDSVRNIGQFVARKTAN